MREVFLVSDDNKMKAELALKTDEIVNRGSIITKSAVAMGLEDKGVFIILDAPESTIERAKELLKDIAEVYKNKEPVLKKFDEENDAAAGGLGFILGD